MIIHAKFLTGMTSVVADKPLHQWDYGQRLQISSPDLPALVEVHFEYRGLKEAIVRSCSIANGVGTVSVPDSCLEQPSDIIAWIFCIDGTCGSTEKKILIKMKERARPQSGMSIPVEVTDKYTDAINAMNDAVASVAAGNVTTARAIADGSGNNIPNTYATKEMVNGAKLTTDILVKVEELCAAHRDGVHWFKLGGGGYDNNLPAANYCYGYAVALVWWDVARVYLLGDPNSSRPLPMLYNAYSSNEWSGWVTIVDSNNIGSFEAKSARYVQVPLKIIVNLDEQTADTAEMDLTYYQDGTQKTISSVIGTGAPQTFDILADLGSLLSTSNSYGFQRSVDHVPFVEKDATSASGAFAYKELFAVICRGTANFTITGKG